MKTVAPWRFVLLAVGALGCGPSVRDLVAQQRWREANLEARDDADFDRLREALRRRSSLRLLARAYSPAELTTLLGWVPAKMRRGEVVLMAYRVEASSPDAPIAASTVGVQQRSSWPEDLRCCADTLAWNGLDDRYGPTAYAGSDGSWLSTARNFFSAFATPVQTIVGTLRDATTLSTGGAIANTPVTGPGLDLSVGAMLARMGLALTSAAPTPEQVANRAITEGESRARLHALLTSSCDFARDAGCVHYGLWRYDGEVVGLDLSYRYMLGPDATYLEDHVRLSLPPGPEMVSRVHALFPEGARPLGELAVLRYDEASMSWGP